MLSVRLRRFVSAHQRRFVPLLIAIGAGALSLFLTVRACRVLSPADSALVIIALGTLCEVAKLSFGPRALLGFLNARHLWERVGYLALGALVLVLMAGSVGATFVFTVRTEAQAHATVEATHAQALADSDAYRALTVDIETHAARIAGFIDDARALRAANRPTAAAAKDELLLAAQAAKDAAVGRRAVLHGAVLPSATGSGETTRWVHLVVAMMLELVGIAACVLVHVCRPSMDAEKPSVVGGTVVPIGAACRRSRSAPSRIAVAPSVGGRLVERCAEARQLIETGQIDPSLEALARALRISQRPGQRLLRALADEGVIQWAGNRYRLLWGVARVAV